MAVGGDVAPSGAVLAVRIGIDDLLAARAEAQRGSVDFGEEAVAADPVSGNEAALLAEPRGLRLAPAQVALPQACLLGRILAILLGIAVQPVERVGAEEEVALL